MLSENRMANASETSSRISQLRVETVVVNSSMSVCMSSVCMMDGMEVFRCQTGLLIS